MPDKVPNKGELPPEVDKYLAALVKDPRSKAFVPLADAYRKAGMIDQAIQVAKDGLKFNPNYISGRLVLGRCYFEKGMLKEAEEELTKVTKVNQENADAQRLLAKIREKTGRIDEAIKTWDIVLTLSPGDTEAKQKLEELKQYLKKEEPPKPVVEERKEPPPEVKPEQDVVKELKSEKPVQEVVSAEPQKVIPSEIPAYEAEEFTVSGPVKKELQQESVEKKTGEVKTELPETEAVEHSIPPVSEIPVSETEKEESPREIRSQQIASEVSGLQPKKVEKEETKSVEETPGKEPETKKEEPAGISTRELAELYIKQGFLDRALKMYRELESRAPDDVEIKRKIEFLTSELKKKSAGTEETKLKENIKTLSSWLEKIKRGG